MSFDNSYYSHSMVPIDWNKNIIYPVSRALRSKKDRKQNDMCYTQERVAQIFPFPDGLCGGPQANALNAPLILTAAKVETQASSYMKDNGIKDGMVLGGTSALPEDTVAKVFS